MHLNSLYITLLALLLTWQAVEAGTVSKRAELSKNSGSSAIQWSDSTGNHIRSYHIRSDCKIVENSHNSGSAGWVTNTLPFCAHPEWNVVATYVRGGYNQLPEQIQLFWTENGQQSRARSAWWRADTGW
jgi:hypothetical protein